MDSKPAGTRMAPAMRASPKSGKALADLVHSRDADELCAAAADPALSEELALALLSRRDLPAKAPEQISKNATVIRHRKVIAAVICHARTPRHVSLPLIRHLHAFELMQVALTPALAADLKIVVEEALILRLESMAAGERLTLAKRASNRVAAALLADPDERVIVAALANPFMTEEWIVKVLGKKDSSAGFVQAVCRHPKWSARRDVQIALLRNQYTPLATALACAGRLSPATLRDILEHSRLSPAIRMGLLAQLGNTEQKARSGRSRPSSDT